MSLLRFQPRDRELGQAYGHLIKAAGDAVAAPVLSGRLFLSSSGWLMLSVPNAFVRGLFDTLDEEGLEIPPGKNGNPYNAHISVMRPEEVEAAGGGDKITERGKVFHYQLGPLKTVAPMGWDDMSKVWFVEVQSPELRNLRKSYGLPGLPQKGDAELQFHITVAVRRKKVLQENDVKKAAGHVLITGASGAGKSTLATQMSQDTGLPVHNLDDAATSWRDFIHKHELSDYLQPGSPHYDEYQSLRRQAVEQAIRLPTPHIIEGTHIAAAPDLLAGHRLLLVQSPLRKLLAQRTARVQAKREAAGKPPKDSQELARNGRLLYDAMKPELAALKKLPATEIVRVGDKAKSASVYLDALKATPFQLQPGGFLANLKNHLLSVKSRGDRSINEAYGLQRLRTSFLPPVQQTAARHQQMLQAIDGVDPVLQHPIDRMLYEVKTSSVLPQLQEAKAHSDKKNYKAKHVMLRQLIAADPKAWRIDSRQGGMVGITHRTGFRFHVPPPVAAALSGG